MYVLVKISVIDMESNKIKWIIDRKRYIQMRFNFKCVLTFASLCRSGQQYPVHILRSETSKLIQLANSKKAFTANTTAWIYSTPQRS
jgi:hypothetical protein